MRIVEADTKIIKNWGFVIYKNYKNWLSTQNLNKIDEEKYQNMTR